MKQNSVMEFVLITFGILLMGIGFHYFLYEFQFIAGGVGGIAIIIEELFHIDVALLIYIMNGFALILGLIYFGKTFVIKTLYGSFLFPFAIQLSAYFDSIYQISPITDDTLLAVIFASLFTGFGFGLVIKFGGSTGGMDIPQKILTVHYKVPFSLTVYLLDGLVILIGTIVFGLELGMYSIIALILIGQFIDLVLLAGTSSKSIYIITNHPDEIMTQIFTDLDRGVTKLDIVGGYSNEEKTMLLCVVANREYYNVVHIVQSIDDKAFVFVNNSSEVLGEGFSAHTSN